MKNTVEFRTPAVKHQEVFRNSMCLDTSIAILKCSGVWMPDLNSSRKFYYKCYAFLFQFVLFFCVVIGEIGYVFKVMGDTHHTIEATVLLFSHLVQGVKVLTIVLRQRRIRRLMKFMDGPDFNPQDEEKRAVVHRTINTATSVGQAIIASTVVTALFWCIVPLLKSEVNLPLNMAFPDWSEDPMFSIMYTYTAISVTAVGVSDAAENYLVSGLMIMGAVQLDVLISGLQQIGNGGRHTEHCYTVRCIKLHQNIIKYVDELASIFGIPIFCQFITSSVIICMTLFKITITIEPVELLAMTFYLICVFMELLMYCFPGDLLINKSLLVAEAAFPNKWSGDIRTLKALLLTALRAQRPLLVNAGGLFKVALPTAAAVVRTAYSYYAVLNQKINEGTK